MSGQEATKRFSLGKIHLEMNAEVAPSANVPLSFLFFTAAVAAAIWSNAPRSSLRYATPAAVRVTPR